MGVKMERDYSKARNKLGNTAKLRKDEHIDNDIAR